MFEDKTLVCKDCGKEFVWTAGEQEFYAPGVFYYLIYSASDERPET